MARLGSQNASCGPPGGLHGALRQVNSYLTAFAPRRPPEAYGRRRHARAPGVPPEGDPFPGWPSYLLDGLLQGGAHCGMRMLGDAKWKGLPNWLQYLLVLFYLLSALVILDIWKSATLVLVINVTSQADLT